MNYVYAGLLSLAVAVSGCATGEFPISRAPEAPWTAAAAARTRADHEAVAESYEREAASSRERAAAHRRLRDSYASSGLFDATGMVGHCTNLILKFTEAANDNAALASLHRRLAGEVKE